MLAQYATPAELLMAPADAFVEDFVGADRALKRLSLLRVGDIDLWQAPLAFPGQATSEVRAKLEGAEVSHALVVDADRRPLGWLSEADLAGETVPKQPATQPRPGARARRRAARRALRPAPGRDAATRRWSTPRGGSRACSRSRSSPSSCTSPDALEEEHPAAERPSPEARDARRQTAPRSLAQLGEDFFRERSDTGCVPENGAFCFDWAADNFDRYVTPASSTWSWSSSRSCSASRSPSGWRCSRTGGAGCSPRSSAPPGSSTRCRASPSSSCCFR